MTRRLLPIVGLMTVLAAGAATAADVSALRTMPVVSSSYNWTGCYVGINAGGVADRNNLVARWADGGLFGGQGGCNYQIDHIVVGLELEGMWSGASATLTAATFGGPGATVTTFKNEWDADLAFRFGLAYDRFVIYEKIGVLWGDNQFNTVFPSGGGAISQAGSVTTPGLMWGFGVEYGLLPKWTVKIESDFAYLAGKDMNLSCVAVAPASCIGQNSIVSTNAWTALYRIGLNYRL